MTLKNILILSAFGFLTACAANPPAGQEADTTNADGTTKQCTRGETVDDAGNCVRPNQADLPYHRGGK